MRFFAAAEDETDNSVAVFSRNRKGKWLHDGNE